MASIFALEAGLVQFAKEQGLNLLSEIISSGSDR